MTKPRASKPAKAASPGALFLVTEPDALGAGLRAGRFENPSPDAIRAYEPDDLGYSKLTPRNSRYLQVERLWPVRATEGSALARDATWGGWSFQLVELGAPLALDAPATWQVLLDAGIRLKPRTKELPSLMHWPAIKGHVDVLRLLLDAGAHPGRDDLVMSAAAFGMRATARLLVERGFDGKQAVVTMQRYKNEAALEILRELGFT